MDIVNAFFRKHYPPDFNQSWETLHCGSGTGRRYTGDRGAYPPIFPEMLCADGFQMSVQAHFGAYSWPRDDFAGEGYETAEVMTTAPADPLLETYGRQPEQVGRAVLYPYVPTWLIERIIEKHGGLMT